MDLSNVPGPFPKIVPQLMASIYYPRGKLVKETNKCWGEDSEVTGFEKAVYEEYFGMVKALAKTGMTRGKECEYIPIGTHRNVKRQFVKDMNKLLGWAGLKSRAAEELI
jgi:hypothetical protein